MSHKYDNSHYTVHLGDRGRMVLPAEVRRTLGLQAGDRLILTLGPDASIRLVSARRQARDLKGLFKQLSPDRELVKELIQERREEAQRDSQK